VVVGRLASMGVTFGLIVTVLLGRERPAQDVVSELGRLSAESAAERHDAERWLAVHLQPRDLPDVAQVLKDGTPEAQRRIVHLLGSDDRHLELAAQLSMEGDDDIAGWGAEAVEAMYLRWNPAARDDPLRPGQLPLDWETEPTTPLTFDPGHGSLWEVLDRLDRYGLGYAPIVVDPNLDPSVRRPIEGEPRGPVVPSMGNIRLDWSSSIGLVCATHRIHFEVHGFRQDGLVASDDVRPWVRVYTPGATGWNASALQLHWVRGVLKEHAPRWNRAAARALAASEWPAALAWLERRWVEFDDPAGLAGVLHGAARGRVAPVLMDADTVVDLVHTAERWLRADVPEAELLVERVARALAQVPAVDARGRSITTPLLDGLVDAEPASQWMRLVALEGQAHFDAAVVAVARDLLATPGEPATRLAALGALQACSEGATQPFDIAAPLVLIGHATAAGRLEDIPRALAAVGARPDPRAPFDQLVTDGSQRLALVEWLALIGETERAVNLFLPAAEAEGLLDPLTDRVRIWVGLGQASAGRDFLQELERTAAPLADRFAVRSGLATDERIESVLSHIESLEAPTRADWIDVASLAAHEHQGSRVREFLLNGLVSAESVPDLLPAILRAQLELQRDRRSMELSAFSSSLGRKVRSLDTAVPLSTILPNPYAPLLPSPTRRLEALDRRLIP
tara:strand:- start:6235 stop:8280 length:2046 start_codon:yes stop_codon:yes gene_type:complete